MKNKKRYGFTLVELLVVLLILGVLVGLAVPRYMDAQKNARFRTFTANVREIQSTLEVYRMDKTSTGPAEYPDNLGELTSYFTQPPINPYTGESMLSANSTESGLQYTNNGSTYTLTVVQPDVDDVNKNGDTTEPLPVALNVASGTETPTTPETETPTVPETETPTVPETCSVVTGTIEPYIDLYEWFYTTSPDSPYGSLPGIILDRTYIDTTQETINPGDELNAFQTNGNVHTDGNYMICTNDCEVTTLNVYTIWSNNADDSAIEFTANIPEIETGVIEIGLKDFYLRYDGDSHTMKLCCHSHCQPLNGWYTGTHTFRFEFHRGRVRIKVDNEVLWPFGREYYFDGAGGIRLFNENGAKFFVLNVDTNAAVQIGTIAITINEYEFTTTGTYISSIYDISTPNFITGTTEVWVYFYGFEQFEYTDYTDFTLEYQLSLNGGATWGDWQPVDYNYRVVSYDFLRNINLENARIRLRVTLSTNNTKFSPEIWRIYFKIYNALAQP